MTPDEHMNIVRADTDGAVTGAVIDGTGIVGVVTGAVTTNGTDGMNGMDDMDDKDITVGIDVCTGDNFSKGWTITICCVIAFIGSVITCLGMDDVATVCTYEGTK